MAVMAALTRRTSSRAFYLSPVDVLTFYFFTINVTTKRDVLVTISGEVLASFLVI